MADSTTSALTAAGTLTGTEAFALVQSGSKKGLISQIGAYIKTLFGLQLNNLAATVDPTTANDNTQGYGIGSRWFNKVTGTSWELFDATTNLAIWLRHDYADHSGYVVGNFYIPAITSMAAGTALTANIARFIPFIPKADITLSALAARVSTVGTTNFQLAIYASDPTTKRPTGSQLAATANLSNTGVGAVSGAVSVALQAGVLYWLGINNGDSTAIFYAAPAGYGGWLIGSSSMNTVLSNPGLLALTTPLTFGTWGDLTAATWTELSSSAHAVIGFKVGSIP